MRFVPVALVLFWCALLAPCTVRATPTQFGDSGLLSQPVAQTLNEGNICIGLWGNCNGGSSGDDGAIVPITITMGLGTFMEVYGSYPNLSFNGDEDASGRGYANAGFKFRVYGNRSDPFRVGLDLQARRTVSDNPRIDGLTDYGTRVIASYKLLDNVGLHANVGYLANDSARGYEADDQVTFGGAVEFFPVNRMRLVAEVAYETEKFKNEDSLGDATLGFQYFLTPHLTMNFGAGVGITDTSADWRALFGFSTCQGVGTFNRPVPKLVQPIAETAEAESDEPVKVAKIKTLTPLIPKIGGANSPVSQLEVPVEDPREKVVVDPADRLKMPEVSRLDAPAIAPIGGMAPKAKQVLPTQPIATKVYRKFRFPEFTFAFNQYDLSKRGEEALSLVADELRKENRYFILSIEGHTDNVGSDAYNQRLSFKRAVTAATHLVLKNGMDPARLFVKGHGETRPLDDNANDEGRAKNRRVELLVLVPDTSVPADNGVSPVESGPQVTAEEPADVPATLVVPAPVDEPVAAPEAPPAPAAQEQVMPAAAAEPSPVVPKPEAAKSPIKKSPIKLLSR